MAGTNPAIRHTSYLFLDTRKPILAKNQKTAFFRQNSGFFDKWSLFLRKYLFSDTTEENWLFSNFSQIFEIFFFDFPKKPKKVKSLNFFPVSGHKFFHYPSFSAVKTCDITSEKILLEHVVL